MMAMAWQPCHVETYKPGTVVHNKVELYAMPQGRYPRDSKLVVLGFDERSGYIVRGVAEGSPVLEGVENDELISEEERREYIQFVSADGMKTYKDVGRSRNITLMLAFVTAATAIFKIFKIFNEPTSNFGIMTFILLAATLAWKIISEMVYEDGYPEDVRAWIKNGDTLEHMECVLQYTQSTDLDEHTSRYKSVCKAQSNEGAVRQ